MTKLSNVPMQPNPISVEPLTLIEKLNEHKETITVLRGTEKQGSHEFTFLGHHLLGFQTAIDIVKQHQSWRKIPNDEKPQDMQAYNLLLKNDSSEYPTLYSVGLFKEYANGHVWLSLVEAETYIDESKILALQPMSMPNDEFFESLEVDWVQDAKANN